MTDEISVIMSNLTASRDRYALFTHELTAGWEGTHPDSPAQRQELIDAVAAISDVMSHWTDTLLWIVRVILNNSTDTEGRPHE